MPRPPGGADRPASTPLRVFRIDPGERWSVLMLDRTYGGLFVHWCRGRNLYCDPRGCDGPLHRMQRVWKGYAAAHLWVPRDTFWLPVVLEITESLELDFRGVYGRGQVWELSRDQLSARRKPPVKGKLVEKRPAGQVPDAFDVRSVLMHLYHVDAIDLTSKNPLPPRQLVEPVGGAPPSPAISADQADTGTAADWSRFREALRGGHVNGNGKKAPS